VVLNETEFRIVSPHGEGGKTASYQFTASPAYRRVIELLYSDPRVPWRSEVEVLRALIDEGVQKYGAALHSDVVTGMLHELRAVNNMIADARAANDFIASVESLAVEVKKLQDNGLEPMAVGLVHQFRQRILTLGNAIIRDRIVGEINVRFAVLLGRNGMTHEAKPRHERPTLAEAIEPKRASGRFNATSDSHDDDDYHADYHADLTDVFTVGD